MQVKKYLYSEVFHVPIYMKDITVIISNDKKKIFKIVPKSLFFEDREIYAHTLIEPDGNIYILLNFNANSKITNGVISHEALHAANFLFSRIGYTTDQDNDETVCYLLEYIVDEIDRIIHEYGFKTT